MHRRMWFSPMRAIPCGAHHRVMTQQHFVFNSLVEYLEHRQQRRDDRRLARSERCAEPQPVAAPAEATTRPARPVVRPVAIRHLVQGGLAAPAHDSLG